MKFEGALAQIVWEMDQRGLEITEESAAEFAMRSSSSMRRVHWRDVLVDFNARMLIVVSLKPGIGLYVRYVSPRLSAMHRLDYLQDWT
jgi:hypothetical protein